MFVKTKLSILSGATAPTPLHAVGGTAVAAAGLLAAPPLAPLLTPGGAAAAAAAAAALSDPNHRLPDVARFFAAGRPDLRVDWGTLEHLFCASFNAMIGPDRVFESQGLPFLRQQVVMVAKWAGLLDRLGSPGSAVSPPTGSGGSANFVVYGATGPLLFTLGELQPVVIWWTSTRGFLFIQIFFF